MLMGPMTHAPWLGSCVFDGARAFEGTAPDLDQHCRRIVRSAESFGLKIVKRAGEIEELIREGIAKFPKDAELYLRPMFWAADGFVDVDPEATEFSVSVYDSPIAGAHGFLDHRSRPSAGRPSNMHRQMPRRLVTIPIRRVPCARRRRGASTTR